MNREEILRIIDENQMQLWSTEDILEAGYDEGYQDCKEENSWIDIKNKDAILPSKNTPILVTDGKNYQLITVEKFLENVDKPYNAWTHWMKIPKI